MKMNIHFKILNNYLIFLIVKIKSTNKKLILGHLHCQLCIDEECVLNYYGCNIEHYHSTSDNTHILFNEDNTPNDIHELLHDIDPCVNDDEDEYSF